MTTTQTTINGICIWCGITTTNNSKYCCKEHEVLCQTAYHQDMANTSIMPPAPVWEIHGDTMQCVCSVCEKRLTEVGSRTCSDPDCKDCWHMAWDTK